MKRIHRAIELINNVACLIDIEYEVQNKKCICINAAVHPLYDDLTIGPNIITDECPIQEVEKSEFNRILTKMGLANLDVA